MSDDFLTLDQIGQRNLAWFAALMALHHHECRRLEILVASRWSPPEWVCSELKARHADKRRPWPNPPTEEDRKLIAAANAYRREPWIAINERGDREKRGDDKDGKIKRIADKYRVGSTALDNFLNHVGGTYRRIREWQKLERAFEEWKRTLYLGPPPISQPASGGPSRPSCESCGADTCRQQNSTRRLKKMPKVGTTRSNSLFSEAKPLINQGQCNKATRQTEAKLHKLG